MSTLRIEEAAHCLLCGTPGKTLFRGLHDRLYLVEGEFGFARCSTCGLVWESPRPTIDDIPKCYPDDYEPHEGGTQGEAPIRPASGVRDVLRALILSEIFGYTRFKRDEWWASVGGRVLGQVPVLQNRARYGRDELCPPFVEGGTLLDIGCGAGGYLSAMKALGWTVLGVDPSPQAARIARENYEVPVKVGTLETAGLSDRSIAVVTMVHAIEHVLDPLAHLRQCHRVLQDGGRLILTTPNIAGLMSRLFKEDWMALEPPRHLWLFTPNTLRTCVERAGFRVERLLTRPFLSHVNYEKSLRIRRQGHARGTLRPCDAGPVARGLHRLEQGLLPFWPLAGNELMLSAVKQ
ncbi:MAG: class I SAM-dependent methyltransferase [Nitrospiraceae bacterium]|nr:MAG: class I SAM-dependent methyltransferase [Nitrospiraceae bacterium]